MSSTSRFHMVNGQRVLKPTPYRARPHRRPSTAISHALPDLGPREAPRLLLPPGIGDVHWVMLRMRAYSETYLGGARPDVWIVGQGDRDRAAGYVERCPSVRYRGTFPLAGDDPIYHAAFHRGEQPKGVYGFDQVVSANVHLERNGDFGAWMPELVSEWDYQVEERGDDAALAEAQLAVGPYVLASFFRTDWYGSHFLPRFSVAHIAEMLKQIAARYRVLLTGAWWDRPFLSQISAASGASMEIVGQTTCAQLLALLRRCSGFVGHAAGNGIMAAHFRRPTALLWSSSWFKRPLFDSWVRPEDRGSLYRFVDVATEDPITKLGNWP